MLPFQRRSAQELSRTAAFSVLVLQACRMRCSAVPQNSLFHQCGGLPEERW